MTQVELRITSSVAQGLRGLSEYRSEMKRLLETAAGLRQELKAGAGTQAQAARENVAATQRQVTALREQISAQQEVTASYKRGSEARQISTKLEIDLQRRLQAALGETAALAGRAGKAQAAGGAAGMIGRDEKGFARGVGSKLGVAGAGLSAIAGPGFIAGAIGGLFIDQSVKAANAQQESMAQLRNAIADTRKSYGALGRDVEGYIKRQEEATGFEKSDVRQTLSQLVRSTGDLGKAEHDEALMADIARARHTDLQGAMMLVLRASEGNVGSLRRLGIDVQKTTTYEDQLRKAHETGNLTLMRRAQELDKAATRTKIMQEVTQRFSGASSAYMKTYAGETDRLKNTWRDLEIEVGQKAIPVLQRVIGWILDGIDALRKSKTAHEILRVTVELLKDAWLGWKTAFEAIRPLLEWLAGEFERHRKLALILAGVLAALFAPLIISVPIAIGVIVKEWSRITGFFKRLWDTVRAVFNLAWDEMKIGAVKAVLQIIEPFSHLPGSMGKWARDMKDNLHAELVLMGQDAQRQGETIGTNLGESMNAALAAQMVKNGWTRDANGIWQPNVGTPHGMTAAQAAGLPAGKQFAAGSYRLGVVQTAEALGVGSGGTYRTGGGHGGVAKPGTMLDCSGYVYQVYMQNGFKGFPGTSETQWATHSGPNWTSQRIGVGDAQPGDVVFMVGSPEYPSPGHVGIVVSGTGRGATVMQYYSSGKPPDTIALSSIGDLVGIKRFYLVKKDDRGGTKPQPKPKTDTATSTSTADAAAFEKDLAATSAAAAAAKATKAAAPFHASVTQMRQDVTDAAKRVNDLARTDALPPSLVDALRGRVNKLRDELSKAGGKQELPQLRRDLARLKADISEGLRQATAATDVRKNMATLRQDLKDGLLTPALAATLIRQGQRLNQELAGKILDPADAGMIERNARAWQTRIKDALKRATDIRDYQTMLETARTQFQDSIAQATGTVHVTVTPAQLQQAETEAQKIIRQLAAGVGDTRALEVKLAGLKKTIQQGLQDAASVFEQAKTKFEGVWANLTSAIDTEFGRITTAQVNAMQAATSAEVTRMTDSMNAKVQQMQDAAQRAVAALQVTVRSAAGSFRFGGSITQTPAEQELAAMEARHAEAQQQAQLAADQAAGDAKAVAEDEYQIRVAALQKQADIERTAANDQLKIAQDALQKRLDAQVAAYQKQQQAQIDAYQKQQDIAVQAYQDQRALEQQQLDAQLTEEERKLESGEEDYGTFADNVTTILRKHGIDAGNLSYVAGTNLVKGLQPGINAAIQLWNDYAIAMQNALNGQTTSLPNVKIGKPDLTAPGGAYHKAQATAHGGVHLRPTVRMVGEQGAEATVPLASQQGLAAMQILADGVVRAMGGRAGVGPVYVTGNTFLGSDRQTAQAIARATRPELNRIIGYKAKN